MFLVYGLLACTLLTDDYFHAKLNKEITSTLEVKTINYRLIAWSVFHAIHSLNSTNHKRLLHVPMPKRSSLFPLSHDPSFEDKYNNTV